ncbi:hypothetical protein DFH11DRAFT_1726030 [Phellopilus nigrolimitatus]|nr:hypothetical protein DFH11DRAFT_1726024 [Phellopilus nigrolimitatus]KAH8115818.1 hypothetical protein DFH11DRAFT_1726030 [Phellopilus nigrolimitatus]
MVVLDNEKRVSTAYNASMHRPTSLAHAHAHGVGVHPRERQQETRSERERSCGLRTYTRLADRSIDERLDLDLTCVPPPPLLTTTTARQTLNTCDLPTGIENLKNLNPDPQQSVSHGSPVHG